MRLLIVRLDTLLYYANALSVREEVLRMASAATGPVRAVLFDAAVQQSLDITSSDMLKSLVTRLRARGIDTCFGEVRTPVLEFAAKTGLLDVIGRDRVFPTVGAGVRSLGSVGTEAAGAGDEDHRTASRP